MWNSKGMNDINSKGNQNLTKSKIELEPLPQKHNYLKRKDQVNVPGSAKRMASQRRPESSNNGSKINKTHVKPNQSIELNRFNQDIDEVMSKVSNIAEVKEASKADLPTQLIKKQTIENKQEPVIEFPIKPFQLTNIKEETKEYSYGVEQPRFDDPEPSLPIVEFHEPPSSNETPRPRESPVKVEKPENLKRPKVNNKRNIGIESQLVVKNINISEIINSLKQESNNSSKKNDIDERRLITLKSQITSLVSKNNALLDINKRQRKTMLETLHCLSDAEGFLNSTEKEIKNILDCANPKLKDETKNDFTSKLENKNAKFSKNINAIRKRLENSMKEERRNYTLSNFTNNPYYGNDIFNEHADTVEEEEKTANIKLDRSMIWNLENKLSNVLKRSIELYK